MAGLFRIILVAIVGFFALVAGLLGALLLGLAALFGLVRRPKIHVQTSAGGPRPAGPSRARPEAGDVIDVEATKVETKRELR